MPRRPRIDAPGTAHHIWLRGVDRRALFVDDTDAATYLDRLTHVFAEEGVRCLAWALMENHVHLVVLSGDRSISHAMHRVGTAYARHFNERHGHEGYVFQGRFGSRCIEGDADLRNVVRYVHRNPLAAGRVASIEALETHPWCGHGASVGRIAGHPFHDTCGLLLLFGESVALARATLREAMRDDADLGRRHDGVDAALDRVIESVCREWQVDVEALRAGVRRRDVVAARAVIMRVARSELATSDATIAAAVGVTRQALWRRIGRRSDES